MFRSQLKPRYKRIVEALRNVKPDIYIAMHSCGSIHPLIGDLVEVGINVLNPVKESASDMDQQKIKEEYDGKLSLLCGLDTQQFMCHATAEEIAAEARRLCDTLGKGGGYILGTSHRCRWISAKKRSTACTVPLKNAVEPELFATRRERNETFV